MEKRVPLAKAPPAVAAPNRVAPEKASGPHGLAPPELVAVSALTVAKLRRTETFPPACGVWPAKIAPVPFVPPPIEGPKNLLLETAKSPCGLFGSGGEPKARITLKPLASGFRQKAVPAPCKPPFRVAPHRTPPASTRPAAGLAPSGLMPLTGRVNM